MLEVLKVLGLCIAAAATIWGIVKKSGARDEDGKLTTAGHIAVALAVAGLLVGIVAYGFELSIAASGRAQLATERAAEQAFQREQRQATKAAAARAETFTLQQDLIASQAEQIRAAQIIQGLRALTVERDERLRDLRLAGQVRVGTQQTLSRTQVALDELQRLVQPLSKLYVLVVWDLPIRTREAEQAVQRLQKLVDNEGPPHECVTQMPAELDDIPGSPDDFDAVILTRDCPGLPTLESDPILDSLLQRNTRVIFDLDRTSLEEVADGLKPRNQGYANTLSELDVHIGGTMGGRAVIIYFPEPRLLRIAVWTDHDFDGGSSRIVSIPDLERSQVIVQYAPGGVPPEIRRLYGEMTLVHVTVGATDRAYFLRAGAFREGRAGTERFFVANSIGRPQ